MRVLVLGDIVGKSGRIKIQECLQEYKNTNKIDFVIANGENATSGAGLSSAHAEKILENGEVKNETLHTQTSRTEETDNTDD